MAVRLRVIITVFVIAVLVVVASSLITYTFGERVLRAHMREQLRRDVIGQLSDLLSTLKDAETGERGFVITGDEQYLEPYAAATKRLENEIAKFKSMPRIDISTKDVEHVEQLVRQNIERLQSRIDLRRTAGFDAAAKAIATGEDKRMMDSLRGEIARLQAKKTAALEHDVKFSDEATRTRTYMFLVTGLLNIGVLTWGYRRIAEALKQRDIALHDAQRHGLELQMQKDLLSVTLGSIGDCVLVTDSKGTVTFMNAVAEEVTGWRLAEASGKPIPEIFRILNEHTREPVENPVEKVIKHGVIVGLANHTLLVRKDGSEVPIDDSGAPIRDENGEIRGVVLIFRDFSEQKIAERELRAAKEAAENANKAKDQFLAMLSHELRTPLTPVLATLSLWEASEDVPKSLQDDVQMLRRSIELEARIIDDLLDLTRVARGLLSFSPENTDVHALIEFLIGLSQSEFQNKNLKVVPKFNATRHNIFTDTARLQQVLWNILRNAIKFTEDGGSITITTSNDANNNIVIAISDTGIGMTAETIAKLFVPFEQADPTRHRRYGGLGLGMAISNALVELLNGQLRAESPGPGEGSIFTVTFPAADEAGQTAPTPPPSVKIRGKIKLLLVEDHADSARALVRLLESRGYTIETVPSVATGLEAMNREKYDLLLCDLGLPDGSGIDFIQKVREKNSIPAIALTGFGMQQDVERAQQAGFNLHLTKPVNLQRLESAIWKLLQDKP